MASAGWFDFAAGECQRLYGRELVRPVGQRSVVRWEPVGPVAGFAPWNFPLGNPSRKLAAADRRRLLHHPEKRRGNARLGARHPAMPV